MTELIINLRNKVRAEREVPPEIEAVREQMGQYGERLAVEGELRAEALARVIEKSWSDETLRDLLVALGLV